MSIDRFLTLLLLLAVAGFAGALFHSVWWLVMIAPLCIVVAFAAIGLWLFDKWGE